MNFGMRGHDFIAQSIEELITKCKQYDIRHVQLVLKKSIAGFEEGKYSESYAKQIGTLFAEQQIQVPILGCYINPSETDADQLKRNLDYFIENLHYAKHIGAGAVGLETGYVGKTLNIEQNNTEEAYQYLLRNMKLLCGVAEELGVKIAIEGVSQFVINTPKRMRRLLDDLQSPCVQVIFDPVNYLTMDNYHRQEELVEEHFRLLGEDTCVIHLKDYQVKEGQFCYAYPGKGRLCIEKIFEHISKINPDMPIILEEVKEEYLVSVREDVRAVANKIL